MENIYNLVPREYKEPPKPPIFRSKFDPDAFYPGSTFGCTGSTRLLGAGKLPKKPYSLFGPKPGEPGRTKSDMLVKSGQQSLSGTVYEGERRPPVPTQNDRPVYGIQTSKNFITANAVEAILKVPKSTQSTELNYLKKEDFGKVPAYLTQVKEEIKRENEMIQKYVREQLGEIEEEPQQCEEMPESERRALIAALKEKWDKVNAQYQKITHLVRLDTTGQVRRKEQLENQLKILEIDIEKLERNGPLYVQG